MLRSVCFPHLTGDSIIQRIPCSSVVIFCHVNRYHRLNRYVSRYISYGRHEGNEFHYNDTLKMLSVSYFCELQHKHIVYVMALIILSL